MGLVAQNILGPAGVSPQMQQIIKSAITMSVSKGGGQEMVEKSLEENTKDLANEAMKKVMPGVDMKQLTQSRLAHAQDITNQYVVGLQQNRQIRAEQESALDTNYQYQQTLVRRRYERGESPIYSIGVAAARSQDMQRYNMLMPELQGRFDSPSLQNYGNSLRAERVQLEANRQQMTPEAYGIRQANLTDRTQRYTELLTRLSGVTQELTEAQQRLQEVSKREEETKNYALRYMGASAEEQIGMDYQMRHLQNMMTRGVAQLAPWEKRAAVNTLQSLPAGMSFQTPGGPTTRETLLNQLADQAPPWIRDYLNTQRTARQGVEAQETQIQDVRQGASRLRQDQMRGAQQDQNAASARDQQTFQLTVYNRLIESNTTFETASRLFQQSVADLQTQITNFSQSVNRIPSEITVQVAPQNRPPVNHPVTPPVAPAAPANNTSIPPAFQQPIGRPYEPVGVDLLNQIPNSVGR
jgi:hypothetical protein